MSEAITQGKRVKSGSYAGYRIRKAKKAGPCDKKCGTQINPGDRYVEGDGHPSRGPIGFSRERLCLKCGGANE